MVKKAKKPAAPESVLNLERLVDPKEDDLDQDLTCQICMDIVQQPQECSQCQHIYCLECSKDWKKAKNSCPNQCAGQWKLNEPHKKYKQDLDKLKFKCFYADQGCDKQVTFEIYEKHEQNCEKNPNANAAPVQQQQQQQQPQQQQQQQKKQSKPAVLAPQIVTKAKYECQTDDGWRDYDEKDCDFFEKNFQANKLLFKVKFGGWDYKINLDKMVQINTSTKKERTIKRQGPVMSQPIQQQQQQQQVQQQQQQQQPYDASKIRWCYKGDNGNWATFDLDISKEIEKNHHENKKKFLMQLAGFNYNIDLTKMVQSNTTTKKERQLLRKDFSAPPVAPAQQQQQQQQKKKDDSDIDADDDDEDDEDQDIYTWEWQDTDYGKKEWKSFNDDPLVGIIDGAYEKHSQKSGRTRGGLFKYKMFGKEYIIDFKKMVQTNTVTGFARKVRRIKQK